MNGRHGPGPACAVEGASMRARFGGINRRSSPVGPVGPVVPVASALATRIASGIASGSVRVAYLASAPLLALACLLVCLAAAPRTALAQAAPPPATAIYARVSPAVAVVETPNGHGTGFMLDATHVMTDAHVVQSFDVVTVRFPDGVTFEDARVVVRDRLVDMAVIEIPTPRAVPITIAAPPTAIGAELYVLGYPGRTGSSSQPIFSRGLLSQVTAWDSASMHYVRTDASGEQGVSGGPILDEAGNVVAVVQFGSTQGAYLIGASAVDLQARAQRYLRGEDVDGLTTRALSGPSGFAFDVALAGRGGPERSFIVAPDRDVTATFTLDVTRATSSVAVTVVRADGEWVDGTVLGGPRRTATITAGLEAGEHYWVSVSSDAPAALRLRSSSALTRYLDPDDARSGVRRIVGVVDHGADVDCRPVALRVGQVLSAGAEAVTFDPILYVVSPGGAAMVASQGDGEGVRGNGARVLVTLPSDGDFFVCVGAAGPLSNPGAYVLTIDASRATPVAPSAGSFALSAARLHTARTGNATVTLLDGRLLTLDGLDAAGTPLATAELYDPATGAVTPVAAHDVVARRDPTATLLPDGRVLVVGGITATGITAAVSVYDPATGSWTATGSLNEPRVGAEVVPLDDGRVLVATGTGTFAPLATAEVYDPQRGQFSRTGSMSTARSGLVSSKLADGRVLIAGGLDAELRVVGSAELYDPAAGRFVPTGSLVVGRYNHTSTLLPSGQVLITGGATKNADLASAELYDPETGRFTATGAMQFARQAQSASLLPDGRVLVVSGAYRVGSSRVSVVEVGAAEIYDPALGRFVAAGSMRVPRQQFAGALPDGTLVFMGGTTETATLDSIEAYRPAPPPAGDGRFRSPPVFSAAGPALAIFGGGSVDQLEAAARGAEAGGAWVQDRNGTLHLLIIGGPAFLGDAFRAAFPRGLDDPTPVTLTPLHALTR